MKKRLLGVSVLFSFAILMTAVLFGLLKVENNRQDITEKQIVAVNELEQLARSGDMKTMQLKSERLQESLRSFSKEESFDAGYILIAALCVASIIVAFCYIDRVILGPFDQMKSYVSQIAQGNFDIALAYERSNYFGEFTWAFDSMRREITKARSGERQAIENNKTVIATLSHDIRTPIASIRAYAEGLEANLDCSAERRQRYIAVILKKCDEVSALTDDLVLHSVADLDKLKIQTIQFELCAFMRNDVAEISAGRGDVRIVLPDEEITVNADPNRLLQVCENLINNSRKYAKTKIDVKVAGREDTVSISFRDYGSGIFDEDIPFIFDKFYRGKNSALEQGSGLGLYIVKYITEQMGGFLEFSNGTQGLEVVVVLPMAKVSGKKKNRIEMSGEE